MEISWYFVSESELKCKSYTRYEESTRLCLCILIFIREREREGERERAEEKKRAEDGIRDTSVSRGLGDVYKRQEYHS